MASASNSARSSGSNVPAEVCLQAAQFIGNIIYCSTERCFLCVQILRNPIRNAFQLRR